MANEKQRKTFLSYSRANKDFAIKLAKELKAEGFYIWLDQLDIPAGARWDREVEKALKECEVFMIIMTPASIDSENVLDEIGYAIDNGKRFLPVLLENCDVPLRLRRFQYVDFTNKNFDDGVESAKELLRSLIAQTTIPRGGIPADSPDKDAQVKEETGQSVKQKAESTRLAQTQAEHKDETASFAAERDKVLKASTLMTQGKQFLQEGDLPEAIRIFQQILTLMPNHEKTLTLLAEAEADLLQESESSDRKAKEEADRLAVQKAEANRLTKQKADEELAAKANAESERKAKAKAETKRKAKEEADPLAAQKAEADRVAKQKAEDERLAKTKTKAEADRKAKEEADRLAAQKTEEERIAKAKAETERKAKEEADRLTAQIAEADFKAKEKAKSVEAMPVEIMTEPTPAATAQKKSMSKGLIIGIVAVVVLIVGGIGIGALSNRGTPATEAPYVAEPATEASVVDNPATEAPIVSEPASSQLELIASYSLDGTTAEGLNNYPDLNVVNAPFSDGGIYCNGIYGYPGSDIADYCLIETPPIQGLNYQNYAIVVDFYVSEYPSESEYPIGMTVIMGGTSYRWNGFYLLSNGNIGYWYGNNDQYDCQYPYKLNTWQNASMSYDGTVGLLYLDNNLACRVEFSVSTGGGGADKIISTTNYSNGSTFRGLIRNLQIISGGATEAVEVPLGIATAGPLTNDTMNMDEARAWRENTKRFASLARETYGDEKYAEIMASDNPVVYVENSTLEPLVASFGDCALTQELVNANYTNWVYTVELNGEVLPPSSFAYYSDSYNDGTNDWFCWTKVMVIGNWESGREYNVRDYNTVINAYNDGINDYQPGVSFIREFIVKIP